MNIFVLDYNQKLCAQYHNDRHVVKMILETAQILSSAYYLNGLWCKWMYKRTHENHPCVRWAARSAANRAWLIKLGLELCDEYTYRFGRKHKTEDLLNLFETLSENVVGRISPPALAMPDACIKFSIENFYTRALESYRAYYILEKQHLAKWTRRGTPHWYKLAPVQNELALV